MTGMPTAEAFLMTAAPVSLSRLVISRTLTPELIIPSGMVWNFALSPCAFWTSYSTPASLNAFSRNGRSAVSQRAEEAVSGRITPILPAEALAVPPPPLPLSPESSSPQALRVSTPATPTASTATNCLRMRSGPFRADRRCAGRRASGHRDSRGPDPTPASPCPVHGDADMLGRATYLRRTGANSILTTPLGYV